MAKKRMRKSGKGVISGFFSWMLGALGWLFLKLIPLAILASLVILAGFEVKKILYNDRLLRVQEMKIVPPDALSAESIRALEDKYVGKNILMLDLRKIASQIELGPGAQSIRVIRQMPNTLRVEIKKRKPVANVRIGENSSYAIAAEDGYIIDLRGESDPAWILMEDYGEPFKIPKVGMRLQNKGFAEALRFLREFRKHVLSRTENVTRVRLDPYGGVTIRLGEGPDFRMGRKPADRISFLEKAVYLFKTEPREGIDYIDFQFDRMLVKRKP